MKKTLQKIMLVAAGLLLTTGVWAATNVAQVIKSDGTVKGTYADIKTAVSNWTAGTTLQLLADISTTAYYGKTAVGEYWLNLNGFEWKSTSSYFTLFVYTNTTVYIFDSSESHTGTIRNNVGYPIAMYDGGELEINSGSICTTSSDAAIYCYIGNNPTRIVIDGEYAVVHGLAYGVFVCDNDSLEVKNGAIIADQGHAVLNNGTRTLPTFISISGGKIIGGTSGEGIYHPGPGTLNISGGYVEGQTGVEMRAGTLTMTGGEVVGISSESEDIANGNGPSAAGAGIAICQHTTKKDMNITISGGTIKGFTPLYEANPEKNPETSINKIKANINGGNFETINNGKDVIYIADKNILGEYTVTGGKYSNSPAAYLPAGYVAVASEDDEYPFTVAEVSENPVETDADGNWESAATWKSGSVPTEAAPVIINKSITITSTENVAYAYSIVIEEGGALTVKSGTMLVVGEGGILNENSNSGLVVEEGAKVLINPNSTNTNPYATVELTPAIGECGAYSASGYWWQSFANPMNGVPSITRSGVDNGLFFQQWDVKSGWVDVTSAAQLGVPFKGFIMTNKIPVGNTIKYGFSGNLAGIANSEFDFSQIGYGFFGNSYLAPISIKTLLTDVSGNITKKVTLYRNNQLTDVTPEDIVKDMPGTIKEIKPLEGFYLFSKESDSQHSVDYARAVFNYNMDGKAPAQPELRSSFIEDIDYTAIISIAMSNVTDVTFFQKTDYLNLYESADFSNSEMNEGDTPKFMNDEYGINLYALVPYNSDPMSHINANNLEDLQIGFTTNKADLKYKFTFGKVEGRDDLLLNDAVANKTIKIEEGAVYEFEAETGSSVNNRFSIIKADVPTIDLQNTENEVVAIYAIGNSVYVENNFDLADIVILNTVGANVLSLKAESANSVNSVELPAGSYIASVGANSATIIIK
ncbi:MAG: hypothetical protein MJ003_06900 [Paludibacteraceae bacterium]|nr:hypothetical protein [Paludibacteraceae bacterium]